MAGILPDLAVSKAGVVVRGSPEEAGGGVGLERAGTGRTGLSSRAWPAGSTGVVTEVSRSHRRGLAGKEKGLARVAVRGLRVDDTRAGARLCAVLACDLRAVLVRGWAWSWRAAARGAAAGPRSGCAAAVAGWCSPGRGDRGEGGGGG
ncbi:hypothetical protein J5N97_020972 [Dioscorea zingiberensis]|uniref:Uncharacterized protein n=1 Tax=Dioscorea zingiberensis TaxID=325984 RepID=A0A9D5CI80_9LILI|nr:hypothetical protein J5N97_020972 [Dioscorea zingiberensis]